MKPSIVNAGKVFIGKIASIVLQFIVSVVVARELGPEGRGIYTSIIYVPALLITLGELGITQAVIYHHGRKLIQKQEIFSSLLVLLGFLSFILIAVCLVIYNTYYRNDFDLSWELIAVLQIPISFFLKTSGGFFLGEGKIGVYNKVSWIPALFNVILSFVFLSLFKFGITGALLAWVISQLFIVGYGIRILSESFVFTFSFFSLKTIIQLLKTGIVYAVSLFIIQANYRVDIFILKSLVSYEDIGYYSIGITVSEIIWQIPAAIGVVIMSKTATEYSNHQKFIIAKALRLTWLLIFIVSILMYLIMPYFIEIIYGKEFLASISINRILLFGIVVFSVFKIINSRFAGLGKPYIAILVFIPCLIIKILGNILLVPQFGINGAAWASNFSYIIAGIAMLIAFSKVEKIYFKEIFKYQKSDFDEIKSLISRYVLLRKL